MGWGINMNSNIKSLLIKDRREKDKKVHDFLEEQESDECLTKVAMEIKPGQSEYQIGARILEEFYQHGINLDVLIVGSDSRIFKYRHPIPTNKKVERYVLLHSAARRWVYMLM